MQSHTSFRLSHLGHCGILLSHRQHSLVIDPFLQSTFDNLIRPSRGPQSAPAVDAIFISHFHPDHFSLDSLDLFSRKTPVYFPAGDGRIGSLLREMGFTETVSLNVWDKVTIGNMVITPTPSGGMTPQFGFHVEADGRAVWHTVDTYSDPEIEADVLRKLPPFSLGLFAWKNQKESSHTLDGFIELRNESIVERTLSWSKLFPGRRWIALSPGWESYFFPGVTAKFLNQKIPETFGPINWQEIVIDPEPEVVSLHDLTPSSHGVRNFYDPNPWNEKTESLREFCGHWMETEFGAFFSRIKNAHFLQRWKESGLGFRLEICLPDGKSIERTHAFSGNLQGLYTHLISASVFKGILSGSLSASGAIVGAHVRLIPPKKDMNPLPGDPFLAFLYPKTELSFLRRKARERCKE